MGWMLAVFARVALLCVWVWTPLVSRAFQGGWLWPLVGLLLVPVTTLVFVLVYVPGVGVTGWSWLWLVLAFLFDLGVQRTSASRMARRGKPKTGLPA